jgi:hypothetical protein
MPTAPTETDQRLAADLAAFRAEVSQEFKALAEFKGAVRSDLRWVKGLGAGLLATALSFAGWILTDLATVKGDIRQVGDRLDRTEKQFHDRFDRLEKKLDTLIERTAPKGP